MWQEAHAFVDKSRVIDDTTLDKPYASKMDLVSYHWSGKHHRVVKGINLQSLIWTDGDQLIPIDYSLLDTSFGLRLSLIQSIVETPQVITQVIKY